MLKRMKPIALGDGIQLHIIQTDKFKTNLMRVYFQMPLKKKEATQNALLSMVLQRGTKSYTTSKELSKQLEELYGASLGSDVTKKGERHILTFGMQLANERYLEEQDVLPKGMKILNELIHAPYLVDEGFKEEYIVQEKNNLKERIEGRINDKMTYAVERCIEEMCKEEQFSIYQYGDIDSLKAIDKQSLYKYYQEIISSSAIDICVVGNMNADEIEKLVRENIQLQNKRRNFVEREQISFQIKDVKQVQESMDISQGKLTLGYRTNIAYEDQLYQALVVGSNILGGGPNSKLFRNIREKESLCYYIFSKIEKFKSLMLISSGIEFENYEKAVNLVGKQVEDVKKGDFSEEDIESAKNSIITSIRSMTDTPAMMADFYYTQAISNNYDSLEEIIEKVRKVDKKSIVGACQNIKLDTVYFLKDKKGV